MVRGDVTADVPDMDEHIEPLALAFQEFEKVCWREALGWILHGLIDFSCQKARGVACANADDFDTVKRPTLE